jgi:hypothetical protein
VSLTALKWSISNSSTDQCLLSRAAQPLAGRGEGAAVQDAGQVVGVGAQAQLLDQVLALQFQLLPLDAVVAQRRQRAHHVADFVRPLRAAGSRE